ARHGVTTKQLIAMNDIKDPRRIRPGQKLVIKRAKPVEAKADRKKAPAEEGPAATGESDEGSPAESEPKQTNQLTASLSDQVVPLAPQTTAVDLRERDVQSLRKTTNVASAQPVKARAPKATPVPKAGAATKQVSYTVKGGDTLWDIARRHKVSIADIQKWNNLPDPSSVRPGTKLKIKNK
ncbi:MAG TPA: LysM peptidoglycan-binding domain-containing protein, partial [bacterium]|nr:LysM peptidoglycan-binding domain-containing protein [bacterium]